jgi:juvenile hormone diol kinase
LADPSSDQRISLQEWLAFQDQILGTPGMYESFSKPIGSLVWEIMDGDGDGAASPSDYAAIYTWRGLNPQNAVENFKQLDLNGDGLLTLDEIKVLVEQFYRSDDPQQPGNWFFGPF